MLNLLWPWALILLPLPLLYRRLRSPVSIATKALRAPNLVAIAASQNNRNKNPDRYRNSLKLLLSACWLATLLALSRPVWIGDPVALPTSGRDLLLAVDISPSMRQRDMRSGINLVNRLVAVKAVVSNFVEQREGDRLGLILFGERAYLQTPLTFDRKTMQTLLNEAQIGFAGSRGTAIGDAIGLAVKRLQERPENHRVVILLTDGANNAGALNPLQAAQLAATAKVKIYTIGVGAKSAAELDERTLASIAKITGGEFFRARDPRELAAIYNQLNRLEPVDQEAQTIRPTASLFHWPLSLALLLSLIVVLLRQRGGEHG